MNRAAESIKKLQELQNGKDVRQEHEVYQRINYEKKTSGFRLTKNILWGLFKNHSPEGYVINKRNEQVIYTVLRYFLRAQDFNKDTLIKTKPSLEKGLLIYGTYGVGKSELFEILHNIGRELITKQNCKTLWFSTLSAGSFVDQYMEAAKEDSSTFSIKKYYTGKLYIDDLGFEKKAFNKTEVFGELLFERNRLRNPTYVTTNLNPAQLTERYGDRIGDRLPEMFNIIPWNGQSFRE